MKYLIIVSLLLFSLTSNSQLLTATGSLDSGQSLKTVVVLTPPLYAPRPVKKSTDKSKPDTAYEGFKYSTAFKVVNGVFDLAVQPQTSSKTPIPKADFRQQQRAIGSQKIFTFRSVPLSEDDFLLFRNGTLRPQTEYSVDGNNITYPSAVNKDVFELIMLVRER